MKQAPKTADKPHVLPHILIDALNLAHGGGVVVMARLARAFDAAGYKVTVVAARNLPDLDFARSSITLQVIAQARGSTGALLFRVVSLGKLAKKLGADAVLGFNYHSPIGVVQVTYHINVIPFLPFWQRVAAIGLLRAMVLGAMAKKALRKSHVNIFESRHVQDLAKAHVANINQPMLAYIGSELPSKPHSKTPAASAQIVTITSGARHKRNDLTLQFFRKVLQRDPTARLAILGNTQAILNSLSQADQDFVKSSPAIDFAGYLPRAQLFDLLSQARALVTFSELESFFMVAIEAMAVGCPVIAADNASARESIGTGGMLVASGDIDAAVAALLSLDTYETLADLIQKGHVWARAFDAQDCAAKFVRQFEYGLGWHPSVQTRQRNVD